MPDPRIEYLEAATRYAEAQSQASALLRDIERAGKAIGQHLRVFLQVNFGISTEGGSRGAIWADESRIDLDKWPTPADMKSAVAAWHTAYMAMHEAYDHVPEPDRQGLNVPPSAMLLSR